MVVVLAIPVMVSFTIMIPFVTSKSAAIAVSMAVVIESALEGRTDPVRATRLCG
jgi:hypothetical protein